MSSEELKLEEDEDSHKGLNLKICRDLTKGLSFEGIKEIQCPVRVLCRPNIVKDLPEEMTNPLLLII